MSTFIVQGRWTPEAVKGMLAHPEDRAASLSKMYEEAGGRLLSYYVTFGEYDFLIIAESPSEHALLSGLIVAGAGGAVTNLKTTVALTSAEEKKAFEAAKGLAPSQKSEGHGDR
jgi:uncharacterized protein with GYD domain